MTVIEDVQIKPPRNDYALLQKPAMTDTVKYSIDEDVHLIHNSDFLISENVAEHKTFVLTSDGQIMQVLDKTESKAEASVVPEEYQNNEQLHSNTATCLADLIAHIKEIGYQQRALKDEFQHVTKKVDELNEYFLGQTKRSQVENQFEKVDTVKCDRPGRFAERCRLF